MIIISQVQLDTAATATNKLFQAPVVLENPDLYALDWMANGFIVDKEIISRDYLGAPKVVLATGYASEGQHNVIIMAGKGALKNGPILRSPDFQISLKIGVDTYTATKGQALRLETQSLQNVAKTKSFIQLSHGADKIMGVHFYTKCTKEGSEVVVRIHNGIYENHNGAVFYDSLSIFIDGIETVLAAPLGGTFKHLFRSQEQILRRFHFGHQPIQAKSMRGGSFYYSRGFGAENERLPYYRNEYGYENNGPKTAEDKVSWRLATMEQALSSGAANESVDLYTNRLGPFMPIYLGDSGAGAPGGWGIVPLATRTQSANEVKLLELQHQCTIDRTPRALYGQDGRSRNSYSFKVAGSIPFYFNTIGGWRSDMGYLQQQDTLPYFMANAGKTYNSGSCPYLGSKYSGGMASYEGYDDAHYCRGTQYSKSLVYLTNDWAAKEDLIASADWAHFSWIEFPTSNDYWAQHGHHVYKQIQDRQTSPHQLGFLERAFGWTCDVMAQAYALADDGWRNEHKPWFDAAVQLIDLSMLPSALTQTEFPGSHLHEVAVYEGFPPTGECVAGAIYIGICAQGFQAINSGVYGNFNPIIRTYFNTIMDTCFLNGPYANNAPAYYMASRPADITQPPYTVPNAFAGGRELYNFWWGFMHAYRAVGHRRFLDYLKKYSTNQPTHLSKIQWLFTEANGWNDLLSNAAYYIAEAEKLINSGAVN